jgi:hypothetical protein
MEAVEMAARKSIRFESKFRAMPMVRAKSLIRLRFQHVSRQHEPLHGARQVVK